MATTALGILANWQDFAPNLFEVTLFGDVNTQVVKYYCTALEFNGAGLDLERHDLTKKFVVKEYKFSDQISVTWREDSAWSVRRYHLDWLEQFYDIASDSYVTKPDGKKRSMTVNFQRFDPKKKRPSLDTLITTVSITFTGITPTKMPDIKAGWDTDSSAEGSSTISILYNIDNWEINSYDTTLQQLYTSRFVGTAVFQNKESLNPQLPKGAPGVPYGARGRGA